VNLKQVNELNQNENKQELNLNKANTQNEKNVIDNPQHVEDS